MCEIFIMSVEQRRSSVQFSPVQWEPPGSRTHSWPVLTQSEVKSVFISAALCCSRSLIHLILRVCIINPPTAPHPPLRAGVPPSLLHQPRFSWCLLCELSPAPEGWVVNLHLTMREVHSVLIRFPHFYFLLFVTHSSQVGVLCLPEVLWETHKCLLKKLWEKKKTSTQLILFKVHAEVLKSRLVMFVCVCVCQWHLCAAAGSAHRITLWHQKQKLFWKCLTWGGIFQLINKRKTEVEDELFALAVVK